MNLFALPLLLQLTPIVGIHQLTQKPEGHSFPYSSGKDGGVLSLAQVEYTAPPFRSQAPEQ
jgi:hypothetical protein